MVHLRGVSKAFPKPGASGGSLVVLADVDMGAGKNEFVSIVGRSGCGKTTLLKIVQGLTRPDRGEVLVNNQPVHGVRMDLSFVFQDVGLLLWRDVVDNVALGLQARGVDRKSRHERAMKYIVMMGLGEFAHYYPYQLSGGMAQRVGLARALCVEPSVCLMDEPFGALDALTRGALQLELAKLSETLGTTTLFVTHDVDEAILLSDRIVVMQTEPGRVAGVVSVGLPRPRWKYDVRTDPLFSALRANVLSLLGGEEAGRT